MRKIPINLLSVALGLLLVSTSAWANIMGVVYNVPGNFLTAADPTTFVGATYLGSFTATAINFAVPEAQGTSNPLSEFLNTATVDSQLSGSAFYGKVMSNCANNQSLVTCTGDPYSTAIRITGTGYFVHGQTYSITHDDGVLMYISGYSISPFINAAVPTAEETSSNPFLGLSGEYSYTIDYMATNGNPEILRSNVPVPDGGLTATLLGMALVGIESLRRRLRA